MLGHAVAYNEVNKEERKKFTHVKIYSGYDAWSRDRDGDTDIQEYPQRSQLSK